MNKRSQFLDFFSFLFNISVKLLTLISKKQLLISCAGALVQVHAVSSSRRNKTCGPDTVKFQLTRQELLCRRGGMQLTAGRSSSSRKPECSSQSKVPAHGGAKFQLTGKHNAAHGGAEFQLTAGRNVAHGENRTNVLNKRSEHTFRTYV